MSKRRFRVKKIRAQDRWKSIALTLIGGYIFAWPVGAYLMGVMGPYHHAGVYVYYSSQQIIVAKVVGDESASREVQIPPGEFRFLGESRPSFINKQIVLLDLKGAKLLVRDFPKNVQAYGADVEFTYPSHQESE